jgi:hypothetical protein
VFVSSGTNPYAGHGRLVPDVVPFVHDTDISVPHVTFATIAYVIDQCERPFYEWMMMSHSLRPTRTRHVQVTVHGTAKKTKLFDGHYLRNRSTLDIGVSAYIGIV